MNKLALLLMLSASLWGQGADQMRYRPDSHVYAMSAFSVTTNVCGSVEVYESSDGVTWWTMEPGTSLPTTIIAGGSTSARDPSIMKYGGQYWMVFTTCGAADTNHIGISHSADGKTWSNPILISSGVAGAANIWAPEWFIDPNDSTISGVHITMSICVGCDWAAPTLTSFRSYVMHATSSDMSAFSTAVAINTGVQSIDTLMVLKGSTYYLWYRNVVSNCLEYASATSPEGTFTPVQTGNWMGLGCSAQEGPSMIQIGGTWRLYFDASGGQLLVGQTYFTDSTNDWATWSPAVEAVTKYQAKHATVIRF